jgi:N-sulfoglucosamine sulfohydrolase
MKVFTLLTSRVPLAFATLFTALTAAAERPNILFITMDDMNYDSIASYGCPIPDIAPHIDGLARQGLRFEYAYNQTSSCVPSRNTYQNGRYPNVAGHLSFFNVDHPYRILPQLLQDNGYFTAVVNKPRDSSPTDDYDRYWDHHKIMKGGAKRGAPNYAKNFSSALDDAAKSKKPFYCVVNIADPHKPFFNDPAGTAKGFDEFGPSQRFEVEDVSIPAFLPEHPEILEEMRNYYNSVKRGDDCVGAVLQTLKERGLVENTVVIFISDHGMPLPFAKSSLYPDGLRTPWIIHWPGTYEGGEVDKKHLVSAIDFMPTVLDLAEVEIPEELPGQSVLPLLNGTADPGRDHVFAEFNDNAGGIPFPMRAIHTRDFLYVFNAWATGLNTFQSAATWHKSEGVMKRLARTDAAIAERYKFLLHRTVEEFYDLRSDPHALDNRIDDPAYAEQVESLRARLEAHLKSTEDYLLPAFAARGDIEELQEIYEAVDADAYERAEQLQWKRYKNRAGGTGKNKALYTANQ